MLADVTGDAPLTFDIDPFVSLLTDSRRSFQVLGGLLRRRLDA